MSRPRVPERPRIDRPFSERLDHRDKDMDRRSGPQSYRPSVRDRERERDGRRQDPRPRENAASIGSPIAPSSNAVIKSADSSSITPSKLTPKQAADLMCQRSVQWFHKDNSSKRRKTLQEQITLLEDKKSVDHASAFSVCKRQLAEIDSYIASYDRTMEKIDQQLPIAMATLTSQTPQATANTISEGQIAEHFKVLEKRFDAKLIERDHQAEEQAKRFKTEIRILNDKLNEEAKKADARHNDAEEAKKEVAKAKEETQEARKEAAKAQEEAQEARRKAEQVKEAVEEAHKQAETAKQKAEDAKMSEETARVESADAIRALESMLQQNVNEHGEVKKRLSEVDEKMTALTNTKQEAPKPVQESSSVDISHIEKLRSLVEGQGQELAELTSRLQDQKGVSGASSASDISGKVSFLSDSFMKQCEDLGVIKSKLVSLEEQRNSMKANFQKMIQNIGKYIDGHGERMDTLEEKIAKRNGDPKVSPVQTQDQSGTSDTALTTKAHQEDLQKLKLDVALLTSNDSGLPNTKRRIDMAERVLEEHSIQIEHVNAWQTNFNFPSSSLYNQIKEIIPGTVMKDVRELTSRVHTLEQGMGLHNGNPTKKRRLHSPIVQSPTINPQPIQNGLQNLRPQSHVQQNGHNGQIHLNNGSS